MNPVAQTALVLSIALAAAGTTYLIKGPPERGVHCDAAKLQPDEVCLERVMREWQGRVLWVDARPRSDWQRNGLASAALWNLDASENMQTFEAEVAARMIDSPRVVVYCNNENCGSSRQVAERIKTLRLGNEVFVLYGGWRALAAAKLTRDFRPK
ncbi:MAG: rhodanese-like domain-containing protein [Verrucomicrobia bacterium]|nr:MAG: rhodanese-like domain-containing protein [Verrucomicrobiota bacterium]